ncbi:thioredoxin [Platysternon megacephalum]|uniref:Thioredoxin n=1 Tax=Platysternon megacephalum TaxID=55544 RepID=A0A4D9DI98_9SAUR|nr:thioredoxin [Platysternon megacephalum]
MVADRDPDPQACIEFSNLDLCHQIKEMKWACLGKPFLTSTAEIFHGWVDSSTPEKCEFTLTKVKDLGRIQVEVAGTPWLAFTPAQEAMKNYVQLKLCLEQHSLVQWH